VLAAFVIGIIQYGGMIIAYDQMNDAPSTDRRFEIAISACGNRPALCFGCPLHFRQFGCSRLFR
jgi:hypothetical protein